MTSRRASGDKGSGGKLAHVSRPRRRLVADWVFAFYHCGRLVRGFVNETHHAI